MRDIWMEQCEAAHTIKSRFRVTNAFDYLVGEKLMTFTNAAANHPDFARELPRFASEVRRMFTADEIAGPSTAATLGVPSTTATLGVNGQQRCRRLAIISKINAATVARTEGIV
jgi:hypothetical protein